MRYAMTSCLITLFIVNGLCAEERSQVPESRQRASAGGARLNELLGPGLGEFIFISGGEFTMGRNSGENPDEEPEHLVELSSFYVGRTPVTNSQFVRFLNEAGISSEEYFLPQATYLAPAIVRADGTWTCSDEHEKDAASCQSWMLAEKDCDWLSAKTGRNCRLPTDRATMIV